MLPISITPYKFALAYGKMGASMIIQLQKFDQAPAKQQFSSALTQLLAVWGQAAMFVYTCIPVAWYCGTPEKLACQQMCSVQQFFAHMRILQAHLAACFFSRPKEAMQSSASLFCMAIA